MTLLNQRILLALDRFKQRGYETVSFTEILHDALECMTDKLLEIELLRSGYAIRKTASENFVILNELPKLRRRMQMNTRGKVN